MNATKTHDPSNPFDQMGTAYGFKSMNAHIHLMEAFTALYEAKAEPRVQARLREVFRICRDVMIVDPPGCMNQFFTLDWRPLAFADSFGHDVETTYLLLEERPCAGRPGCREDLAGGAVADRPRARARLGREMGRVRRGGEQLGPGEDGAGEDLVVSRPRGSTRCCSCTTRRTNRAIGATS